MTTTQIGSVFSRLCLGDLALPLDIQLCPLGGKLIFFINLGKRMFNPGAQVFRASSGPVSSRLIYEVSEGIHCKCR